MFTSIVLMAQTSERISDENVHADPPFSGTIFIDPDIITPDDPTTFEGMTYAGQALRTMYDRRVNGWINVNPYLFNASFDDGLSAEIQVNPEFGSPDAAREQAEKYAPVIGQMPTVLRVDVETVWIHMGVEPFGGGNNNLLIHIGQGDRYINDGILEETFVHEAAHTSLDAYHASSLDWLAAQSADAEFISTYARDYPNREDIAESFLPYLAIRYRSDRISQQLYNTIVQTIPNRIDYFDNQMFDMYPIEPTGLEIELINNSILDQFELLQNYPNPFNPSTIIEYTIANVGTAHELSLLPVKIVVYDVLGKEVAILINENQRPGIYNVSWNASGLPAGVYLYRLQAEQFSITRKMILLK